MEAERLEQLRYGNDPAAGQSYYHRRYRWPSHRDEARHVEPSETR